MASLSTGERSELEWRRHKPCLFLKRMHVSNRHQIFILYMILETEGTNDREEINRIIDSFRFLAHPGVY
jgi:hypothetical protein